MTANAIVYFHSHEHQKTSEDALCLASKATRDWNTIHEENNVIKMLEEVANAKKKLKQGKHTFLMMRMEHLRTYKIH